MIWQRPHPDLWTYRVPLRTFGADTGRRGVAVRYAERRWAFIGPVPLTPDARAELDERGSVDTLIVPTAFHNTFVPEACEDHPEALVYAARDAKTQRLPADRLRRLPADLPDELRDVILPFPIKGMRAGHEVVFLHRPSATLVLADLCMHYPTPADGLWTRAFRRAFGWTPGVRVPGLIRLLLKDRAAVRATLEEIRALGVERIVMSHGEPIETNADRALGEMLRQLG